MFFRKKCAQCGMKIEGEGYVKSFGGVEKKFCCKHCADEYRRKSKKRSCCH